MFEHFPESKSVVGDFLSSTAMDSEIHRSARPLCTPRVTERTDSGTPLCTPRVTERTDELIEQFQSVVQSVVDTEVGHVRRETVERELCERGLRLRNQLEAVLNNSEVLQDTFGDEGGERIDRIREATRAGRRSMTEFRKDAPQLLDISKHLAAIEARLGPPEKNSIMDPPIDHLNVEGLNRQSSESSVNTGLTVQINEDAAGKKVALSDMQTQTDASSTPALPAVRDRPMPPSPWIHRAQSCSDDRRRVVWMWGDCPRPSEVNPFQHSRWRDLERMATELANNRPRRLAACSTTGGPQVVARPVRLCAWDREGKVYPRLWDAIVAADGYSQTLDGEEVKLQWMWGDGSSARRLNPLRWSTWKHPGNTAAELRAHIAIGSDRSVRLVAWSLKACANADEALQFVEDVRCRYRGERAKVPRCPDCSKCMLWSNYAEDAYSSGWRCHNFRSCGSMTTTVGSERWFCQDCSNDLCHVCSGVQEAVSSDLSMCCHASQARPPLNQDTVDVRCRSPLRRLAKVTSACSRTPRGTPRTPRGTPRGTPRSVGTPRGTPRS